MFPAGSNYTISGTLRRYWQSLYVEKTLRRLKSVEFDFEDYPNVTSSNIRSLRYFSHLNSVNSQVTGLPGECLVALRGLIDSCGARYLLLPLSQPGFQDIVRLRNLTLLKICGTHATEVEMSLITRLHKLELVAVSSKELIDKGMVNLSWFNELW